MVTGHTYWADTCSESPSNSHRPELNENWEHSPAHREAAMTCRHCQKLIWGFYEIDEEEEPC